MTISKDLFLAILSMDAYNQGYNPGLANVQTTIGIATAVPLTQLNINDEQYAAWQAANFYAVAYKTTANIGEAETDNFIPAGTTIIDYRGITSTTQVLNPQG